MQTNFNNDSNFASLLPPFRESRRQTSPRAKFFGEIPYESLKRVDLKSESYFPESPLPKSSVLSPQPRNTNLQQNKRTSTAYRSSEMKSFDVGADLKIEQSFTFNKHQEGNALYHFSPSRDNAFLPYNSNELNHERDALLDYMEPSPATFSGTHSKGVNNKTFAELDESYQFRKTKHIPEGTRDSFVGTSNKSNSLIETLLKMPLPSVKEGRSNKNDIYSFLGLSKPKSRSEIVEGPSFTKPTVDLDAQEAHASSVSERILETTEVNKRVELVQANQQTFDIPTDLRTILRDAPESFPEDFTQTHKSTALDRLFAEHDTVKRTNVSTDQVILSSRTTSITTTDNKGPSPAKRVSVSSCDGITEETKVGEMPPSDVKLNIKEPLVFETLIDKESNLNLKGAVSGDSHSHQSGQALSSLMLSQIAGHLFSLISAEESSSRSMIEASEGLGFESILSRSLRVDFNRKLSHSEKVTIETQTEYRREIETQTEELVVASPTKKQVDDMAETVFEKLCVVNEVPLPEGLLEDIVKSVAEKAGHELRQQNEKAHEARTAMLQETVQQACYAAVSEIVSAIPNEPVDEEIDIIAFEASRKAIQESDFFQTSMKSSSSERRQKLLDLIGDAVSKALEESEHRRIETTVAEDDSLFKSDIESKIKIVLEDRDSLIYKGGGDSYSEKIDEADEFLVVEHEYASPILSSYVHKDVSISPKENLVKHELFYVDLMPAPKGELLYSDDCFDSLLPSPKRREQRDDILRYYHSRKLATQSGITNLSTASQIKANEELKKLVDGPVRNFVGQSFLFDCVSQSRPFPESIDNVKEVRSSSIISSAQEFNSDWAQSEKNMKTYWRGTQSLTTEEVSTKLTPSTSFVLNERTTESKILSHSVLEKPRISSVDDLAKNRTLPPLAVGSSEHSLSVLKAQLEALRNRSNVRY